MDLEEKQLKIEEVQLDREIVQQVGARISPAARYPMRHGIPCGTLSHAARYPMRHGAACALLASALVGGVLHDPSRRARHRGRAMHHPAARLSLGRWIRRLYSVLSWRCLQELEAVKTDKFGPDVVALQNEVS
jgi:hypothetical protein